MFSFVSMMCIGYVAIGSLANPAAKVDDMTKRNFGSEKTVPVVERGMRGVSPMIAAVLSLLIAAMACLGGFSTVARADDSGSSSESTQNTSGSTSTFTDDVTDVNNLLGSDLTEVTDAIQKTKDETGVTVRLMYLPSFGTNEKPAKWASDVLEAVSPARNTVMLAVASNDGNLVVAVSSNSDEWLKRQQTVDDLSKAAADPLLNSTPDWAGAATAMMDELIKQSKTATSQSSMTFGVVVMCIVLAVLVAIIVATILIRRRMRRKVMKMTEERRKRAEENGTDPDGEEGHLSRREIRMRRKAGMWKQ